MKNKIIKSIITITVGLTVVGSGSVSVNAASWHKGTPKSLQGKWQAQWYTRDGGPTKYLKVIRTSISKKNVNSYETGYIKGKRGSSDMSRPIAMNAKYKYLGKHTYQITGKALSTTYTFKAKWYSHNKIKISDKYETHYFHRY
ncbi:hypothetical protein HC026_06785 [Lactobacillus sp. LC28-10]|uniref:DUF5640 domain-containing protein n=1 Tax=Secundilactobacillus angelensis TaxID=2722706 RepID=A0ABX1KZP4_9LACO|nr:hypothetical protein [Secundilactobacillus angelensis]MCH5461791.1 hypothetical protein [Secundilactobacillus angelensis]NLR18630.1 hypothetical protein [Secundilactobacillus angelensis]